jgi:hypothetical protein
VTSWNDDKSRLTIAWKDQIETYAVTKNAEGMREIVREP